MRGRGVVGEAGPPGCAGVVSRHRLQPVDDIARLGVIHDHPGAPQLVHLGRQLVPVGSRQFLSQVLVDHLIGARGYFCLRRNELAEA